VPTILVVDDEKNLREFYRIELTREGYEVLTASTGKEAIAILDHHLPDAVIMDIRMPDMDGIEALGKIVARYKHIPIILNTAYSSYRDDFRTWAAEAYIVKSSDLTGLKQTLRDVLKKASEDQ
jgi:CheY-like chemotaxis protein